MCQTAAVVDHVYADLSLAALYDSLNPWGPGDDFYLGLLRQAGSVLDIGCGTGSCCGGPGPRGTQGG